jgi:hypothetical protein
MKITERYKVISYLSGVFLHLAGGGLMKCGIGLTAAARQIASKLHSYGLRPESKAGQASLALVSARSA